MAGGDDISEWGAGAVRLVSVTRGGEPDLAHAGMACLVDAQGGTVWSIGDIGTRAFFRSSAKPLQALSVVTSGAADAFGFDDRDLAIICGSHKGGPDQVVQVRGILAKSGSAPEDLGCGDGVPDMCSGKHAGMLAGCRHLGLPVGDYLDKDHPWQRRIQDTIKTYCRLENGELHLAEDGCAAPTFSLPLRNMALGYARLARETSAGGPAGRLLRGMHANPIGHTGEPDMRPYRDGATGVLVTKGGVNGVLCAALPGPGLGFAMKIIDGSPLPRWPVFIEALARAGCLSASAAERMRQALWPRISTRRGKIVGGVRIEF